VLRADIAKPVRIRATRIRSAVWQYISQNGVAATGALPNSAGSAGQYLLQKIKHTAYRLLIDNFDFCDKINTVKKIYFPSVSPVCNTEEK
jgi:hypothetical protein